MGSFAPSKQSLKNEVLENDSRRNGSDVNGIDLMENSGVGIEENEEGSSGLESIETEDMLRQNELILAMNEPRTMQRLSTQHQSLPPQHRDDPLSPNHLNQTELDFQN